MTHQSCHSKNRICVPLIDQACRELPEFVGYVGAGERTPHDYIRLDGNLIGCEELSVRLFLARFWRQLPSLAQHRRRQEKDALPSMKAESWWPVQGMEEHLWDCPEETESGPSGGLLDNVLGQFQEQSEAGELPPARDLFGHTQSQERNEHLPIPA